MAPKRIDPLKAKEAKQKKIAIGGAVLLLALLGFQGPKTLKMLKGPGAQTVTPATTTAPTSTTPAPTTPAGVADPTAAPAPTGVADLAAVADSDQAPVIEQGQLATFERFSSKDPFAQQAEPVKVAPAAPDVEDGTDEAPGTDKAPGAGKAADGNTGSGAAGDGEGDGGFTTGGTAAPPEKAATTSISVNGVAEDVAVEGSFPKDEPTFVLVSLAKDGKSVEIGIAGGEYATGGETMKLAFGKKITLQNTADGSRYEVELHSVQGFVTPKPKPKK
jgi:hypothetical protein